MDIGTEIPADHASLGTAHTCKETGDAVSEFFHPRQGKAQSFLLKD